MSRKLQRVFKPYTEWEDAQNGMWRIVGAQEKEEYLEKAANLMRDSELFFEAMKRATIEWPVSSEVNLSTRSINRQAWIGHAGCCIEIGSPEEVTRAAWHTLTTKEQDLANLAADRAIALWEQNYDA